MNAAHVHLLLNHVPILGTAFVVPLLVWAIVRRSDEVARLALIALVAIGALAVPVFLSGEPAEELIEDQPGVTEHWIAQHEDIAKVALGAALLLGVVALGGLVAFRSKAIPVGFSTFALLLTLGTAGLMATTGWHGGHIRHTEIRAGAAGAGGGAAAEAGGERAGGADSAAAGERGESEAHEAAEKEAGEKH